ncbi:hypothetical protein HDU67_005497 [Dinochytrium kinnereticum]|nr:hypothetical protein HDU67_005497 [Dinochytrium kinnereticum]
MSNGSSRYRTGYTYKENWISLFHLHNESVSPPFIIISTTILTRRATVVGGLSTILRHVEIERPGDKAILVINILCATFTFAASAMYHLHLSHSAEACAWFGCLDYSG